MSKKVKLLFFLVVLSLVLLSVASFITLTSIENAKRENEVSKLKMEGLSATLRILQSDLNDTLNKTEEQAQVINKYQEIISEWSKATPSVNESVKIITESYEDVVLHSHLFNSEDIKGLEDVMMDALYGAIRSTDPLSIAKEFEGKIIKLNERRYDNIIKSKIEIIKKNGVAFPEDVKNYEELKAYFDSFIEDAMVIESFKNLGLDLEIAHLEELIDADEESDLAKSFEKAVAEIQTPITLETSLENARSAWNALCNALEEGDELAQSTNNSRDLLDTYEARINQLKVAKVDADIINGKISGLKIGANLATKNAIIEIEAEISAWIKKFEIDKANESMVNDLTATKNAYENALMDLRNLYDNYKKAVEGIGRVGVNSKSAIDDAFKLYDKMKFYVDTNELFSFTGKNTVEALFYTLKNASDEYNYLVSLINTIRAEIERIHSADPQISYADITALNEKVDELLKIESSINVLNTEKTNYVDLLDKARLLPHKNEAFLEIKDTYDEYYARANNNRELILLIVEIKDSSLNSVEKAKSVEEIKTIVEKTKSDFENCFE